MDGRILPHPDPRAQVSRARVVRARSEVRTKAARGQSAAPPTLSPNDEVVFGRVWPLVSPGVYIAEIMASREKPSPYGARDLAAKHRRPDPSLAYMKWFLDLRVAAGTDGHTARALETWRQQHEGEGYAPVTFFSCPFKRVKRTGRIGPPPRGEKLYDSLGVLLGRPLRPGDRINLHGFVGAYVRVRVVDSRRDNDGDLRVDYLRYSIARKLIALAPAPVTEPPASPSEPPEPPEPIAGSRQPVAYSRRFDPEGKRDQGVTERDSQERDTASSAGGGVASPTGKTGYDRPGGGAEKALPPGPTPSEERKRIKRVFGRVMVDVRKCGPCPRCGLSMFAREYSPPVCVWCEPRGRQGSGAR